jgi:hypothetical protein
MKTLRKLRGGFTLVDSKEFSANGRGMKENSRFCLLEYVE